ncbi:helix-turn-helix transcriptional regulator [Streptantibioticus cattleyicolor]|uniref:Transcriptional regulator, LuxR family n=1 Tax=Streptantibioticus cattleyicolor (strain ATCC 35852 / DSM 46488 / JCM 4925 / NBRC 14057 / NRRL 8057) TaxID=1003195 RepID=F8JKS2_STREN|nr:LuxR family transcriptional regulator [Streptantibioticus cattleyicolor]AEW98433.1 transcriptional regulator, LuxR family [Streptantibioticus cattleyicolor NRRL 8057 = DSM 46488]CCB72511.1 putative LuxR-family transcriptional regulator [Streptantibioticus cattleyicolor NRRL 8057 = DSM 46488]
MATEGDCEQMSATDGTAAAPVLRRAEIDAWSRSLEAPGGTLTAVAGDPGTGKTYLLAALGNEARLRGVRTLTVGAAEAEPGGPYGMFGQLLSAGADTLGPRARASAQPVLDALRGAAEDVGGDAERGLVAAVRSCLLDWADAPLLIALDDFHQAGPGDQRLLAHLLRRPVDRAPLHLVFAQRPRQASSWLLAAIADRAELGPLRRIELGPLGLADSAALLGLRTGDELARRLHRESHGIPLYLRLLAEVPPGGPLPRATADRLAVRLTPEIDALTADEITVAHAGAVLGDRFDLDLLAQVAELSPERTGSAIDRLCRRDLLRVTDDAPGLCFRHPLIGRLLYSQAGSHWRTLAHGRVAVVLAGQGASAAECAWHIERGLVVPDPEDVAVLARAAEERMACDPDAAVRWLRAALRRLPGGGDFADRRVELLVALARTHVSAGRSTPAQELIRDIINQARAASYRVRVEAVAFCAILEATLGRDSAACDQLAIELDTLPAEKQAELVPLLLGRATVAFLGGHLDDIDDLAIALRLARKHHMIPAEAGALVLRGFFHSLNNDTETAEQSLAPGRAILDSSPDVALAAHPEYLLVLGWAEILGWRFGDAVRHLTRAAAVMRQRGANHMLPLVVNGLCYAYQQMGRLAESQRVLADHQSVFVSFAAEAQRILGSALEKRVTVLTEGAEETAGERVHADPSGQVDPCSSDWSRLAALCLADAARMAGRFEPSAELVLRAGGGPELRELPTALLPIAFEALTAASLHVDVPVPTWVSDARVTTGMPHHRAHVLLAQAHVAKNGRNYRSAMVLYRNAAGLFSTAGMMCAQARALVPAAQCAAEDARPEDAMALLTEAEQLAGQCEAGRIASEAGQWRRQLEGLPELGGATVLQRLAELTEREREVAELAASGVRTREIAERLTLSPRTIDVHLTRIYRKLGVRSRVALAGLLATGGAYQPRAAAR